MKLPAASPRPDAFEVDARIPGYAVRAVLVVAGSLLALMQHGLGGWLAAGITLSVAAAWVPEYLIGWVLILFLAAGQLAHHPGLTWKFLVLLAGLHLLHVLSMLALQLPWRSWMQPAVFAAPLRRFIAIQIPTQVIAILALLLLSPSHSGHRPLSAAGVSVVGTAALAALGLLLFGQRSDNGAQPDGTAARRG